jgi:hypothetical protein
MKSKRRDDDASVSSETTPVQVDAAGASIAGVVRGAGGDPVAGAYVSLSSDVGSPDVAQQTGDDGSFRFGHLATGDYVVHVHYDARAKTRKVRVRDEREYEVTVKV